MSEAEVGSIKVTALVTSRFRLDGGSMFGVVPRTLWERKAPPDGLNRIALNSNSLYVESTGMRILVEAGMGQKYDRAQADMYDLDSGEAVSALEGLGVGPGEIDAVVLTHLHLDHAGGSLRSRGCSRRRRVEVRCCSGRMTPALPPAEWRRRATDIRLPKGPRWRPDNE